MIFLGIAVEALPFVLLGVLLSALLSKLVKDETLIRWVPKNRVIAPFFACFLGFMFPVCECGNIPVARRLIQKGLPHYFAVSFLLAAPVLNPIVIFSTLSAFPNQHWILWVRLASTVVIAVITGWIFSFEKNPESLLKASTEKERKTHSNESFLDTVKSEFFEMNSMLIIGALAASFFQILLPRNLIVNLGQGNASSILAMMLLAVLVSICSNVDAFFALSYMNFFTTGSVLAFLIFGPMIDIKALFMLSRIFKMKAILWMALIPASSTFLIALLINLKL